MTNGSDTKYTPQYIVAMFVLCIFFPILGGVLSLLLYRSKNAKNLFWIFCSFLGMIQIYHPEGMILGQGADAGRYALEFINMHNNISTFSQFIGLMQSNIRHDIYQLSITYIVSRFTDNPRWLFFVFAIIYGFFYSRNVWYLLDRLPKNISIFLWIIVVYYILVCPIWNINGVRMWTALHVFCYGLFPYLLENDKSKLLISVSSILIHFSFLMPVALLCLFLIFPNKIKSGGGFFSLLVVFYIITFFIEIFSISQIGDLLYRIAPGLYESNIEGYLGIEYVDRIQELANEKSLLYKFVKFIEKYGSVYLILFTYLIIRKQTNKNFPNLLRFYSFGLLLYSIANILSIVPSGGRFIILAKMIVYPSIIIVLAFYYKYTSHLKDVLLRCVLVLFLIPIIMQLRIGAENYGLTLFFGNFITAMFVESNISLFRMIYLMFY